MGAVRQHSILFCDDDIDVTIINDRDGAAYDKVSKHLSTLLGGEYMYSKRPWEGGDKVRPRRMSNVFVDIFTLREYSSLEELVDVIGVKRNGMPQSEEYVRDIVGKLEESVLVSRVNGEEEIPLYPFWHFNERKAIEMWPREIYRAHELFPLCGEFKFGPLTQISGPRMPVLLLKRAFGLDCFDVYYQSGSHNNSNNNCNGDNRSKREKNSRSVTSTTKKSDIDNNATTPPDVELKPIVLEGGNWSNASKVSLSDEHYLPMQPIARAKRRYTAHNKEQLLIYLEEQSRLEEMWMKEL